MNLNNLLNNVLSAGQEMLNNPETQKPSHTQSSNSMLPDWLNSFGGGAAATGLLGMLMGGSNGRGISNNMMKLGSVAALGSLAYKAYQAWQSQNASAQTIQPIHERDVATQEQHAEIILLTMIAAANADGRIDAQERDAILNEVGHSDKESQVWLEEQISHPLTSAQLAEKIGNDHGLAAESYLAARMVCGDLERHEIIFLHDFAQALGLNEQLVEKLESQAGF